jgi:hypothetical protein
LHVGNMGRTLDLISPDGDCVKYLTNEVITAVPAVTAAHPTLPKYFGGAASGKISYWTTPLEDEEEEEEEKKPKVE